MFKVWKVLKIMAKRFVDTEIWSKVWFQDLPLKEKILVKYIFENCDISGVWNANYRLASFLIGEEVTEEDIKSINDKKGQFEILENGDVFITDFIPFQYGILSSKCRPHIPIIEKIKKHNLLDRVFVRVSDRVLNTLEEQEQEKEQYKEKEKEINVVIGKKFVVPQVEEIKKYCEERKNNVDAERFFDYYESKGWMIGKNKMKDWKAAVRTWEKSQFKSETEVNNDIYTLG